MVREIPSLRILCLRSVGSHDCNAEKTFAPAKDGTPSSASRLLRSFHRRPAASSAIASAKIPPKQPAFHNNNSSSSSNNSDHEVDRVCLTRMAMVGTDASKRAHANDVDINCPFIACRDEWYDDTSKQAQLHSNLEEIGAPATAFYPNNHNPMVIQYGNCALDCLQAYIDALSEQGRMDDTRLGKLFFREWVVACVGETESMNDTTTTTATTVATPKPPKKRKRGGGGSCGDSRSRTPPPPVAHQQQQRQRQLGSLSLHNCTISNRTIHAMISSKIGANLGVLDITGLQNLSDDVVGTLLKQCRHLERLSLKNCRRLSNKCLPHVRKRCSVRLKVLDIGGCINLHPQDILNLVPDLPQLTDLNVSGLDWGDSTLAALTTMRKWEGLSVGFAPHVTSAGFRTALSTVAESLQRLAIPFCEGAVDNLLLGYLGKTMINVRVLDIRGNSSANSLTGWCDGRAAANAAPGVSDSGNDYNITNTSGGEEDDLFVLARYTGMDKKSLEETKRIHPLLASKLVCITDGGGVGGGIRR